MLARKVIRTSFGVALLVLLASSSIGAVVNTKRTTYFTFSKSVELPSRDEVCHNP